jgi:hypothetical protein
MVTARNYEEVWRDARDLAVRLKLEDVRANISYR